MAAAVGTTLWLRKIGKWVPDTFFQRGHRSSVGIAHIARQCVHKRVFGGASRDDLLQRLIEAHQRESGNALPNEAQLEEMTAESVTIL